MDQSLNLLAIAATEQLSIDDDPIQAHRDAFSKSESHASLMVRGIIEKAQSQAQSDSEEHESMEAQQRFVTRVRCLLLNYWEVIPEEGDIPRTRAAKQIRQLIQIAWPSLTSSSHNQKASRHKNKKTDFGEESASSIFTALPQYAEDVRDLNMRHPRTGRTLLMLVCRDIRRTGFTQLLSIEGLLQNGADIAVEDNCRYRAVQYYISGSPGKSQSDEDPARACLPGVMLQLLGDGAKEYVSKPYCNLLHLATEKCIPSVVQSLLTLGISGWNRDSFGMLPVHILCEIFDKQDSQIPSSRVYDMFQLLFQKMRNQNPSFEMAAWQGASLFPENVKQRSDKELLHLTAKLGDAESVRAVLAAQPTQAVARVSTRLTHALNEGELHCQEQWPVHMAFEFPVKSEDTCFFLLKAALQQSNPESRRTREGESILTPLLITALSRKYDRCTELLLATEDHLMLRHRIGPLISNHCTKGSVSLLARCTTSQQFKLLLPRLRRAGADVRDAFTIAAARGWTECAVSVMLDDDIDINYPFSVHALNDLTTGGHHYTAWSPGSTILHGCFVGDKNKPKQLSQMIDLLNMVLKEPKLTQTLDFSRRNAEECMPLISLAQKCKDYPYGPFSPTFDLLLSLPLPSISFSCTPLNYWPNLLYLALESSPHLFHRIMQDRRSTDLFHSCSSMSSSPPVWENRNRLQIVQKIVEQIEKWSCSPSRKSLRRKQRSTAASSSSLLSSSSTFSASSLDLISANDLLTLVRDRFLDYEKEICATLDSFGMYAVVEDIVLQYMFDSQRSAACKVQLDELIDESRHHLQAVFEEEADLPIDESVDGAYLGWGDK